MKIKETTGSISDGDGTIESARQRFVVVGSRGDIKFGFSLTHPEGQQLSDIKQALRTLARKIENGDQIDAFDGKVKNQPPDLTAGEF